MFMIHTACIACFDLVTVRCFVCKRCSDPIFCGAT